MYIHIIGGYRNEYSIAQLVIELRENATKKDSHGNLFLYKTIKSMELMIRTCTR